MERVKFGFEDLEVWRKAVEFARKIIVLTEKITRERKHFRLMEQLESASTSIALNIAEGKGRYSKREYVQFLHFARGSLNETVTLLTICNLNNWISNNQLNEMKLYAEEVSKMLSGLINAIRSSINSPTTYEPKRKAFNIPATHDPRPTT